MPNVPYMARQLPKLDGAQHVIEVMPIAMQEDRMCVHHSAQHQVPCSNLRTQHLVQR